jgi:BirA family biotin operon repressor/biotin-[acetyl-CoA-carboxylase] ligase
MKIQSYHFESIDSTNTWAKQHLYAFDRQALTVVTADEQTAGRGRFKRQWVSPKGVNIYASFCLFVDFSMNVGYIPQVLALSTAIVLEHLKFTPQLKWPNDVLLSGKKVAGILCETVSTEQQLGVVCGIGLNVNMPLSILNAIDRPATSLYVESQMIYSVQDILSQLTFQFQQDIEIFISRGFDSFFTDFVQRSFLQPGQSVRFHDNQTMIEGSFVSLNKDGSITLQIKNQIKNFNSGEFC